jgi:hypothetical protein
VGAANGVESIRFEQLNLSFLCAVVRGGAEGAVVVVHAATSELERLAVDPEPGLRAELDAADAEWRRRRVDDLPPEPNLRLELVALRLLERPQLGATDQQVLRVVQPASGRDPLRAVDRVGLPASGSNDA